jgi:hypothetical protein
MKDPRDDKTIYTLVRTYRVPVFDKDGEITDFRKVVVEMDEWIDLWGQECVAVWLPQAEDEYVLEDLKDMIHDDFLGYYIEWR